MPPSAHTQRAEALTVLASAAASQGDLESARAAEESLRRIAERSDARALSAMAEEAAGYVAAAIQGHREARRRFEAATDLYERGGLPDEAAITRSELARALSQLGRPEAAAKQVELAVADLRRLGADAAATRAEQVLRRPSTSAGPPAGSPLADLSPRETEVLALVVDGLSDKQIAQRLYISAHTVHRHVSNILTKLAVTSRAAAAALGARHGLDPPP